MPKKKKKTFNYLKDIDVREVTLCKSPVQGGSSKFSIIKSKDPLPALKEGQENLEFFVPIIKSDKAKKLVYGYVLVPNEDQFVSEGKVEDSQGDIITHAEVEKAAHSFLKNMSDRIHKGSGTGLQHIFFDDIGYPVESYVDTDGVHGRKGGWVVGTKITSDRVWDAIEKGEITGYSMGGTGYRRPVDGSGGIESPQDSPVDTSVSDTFKGDVDSEGNHIDADKGVKVMEITAEVKKTIGDIVSDQLAGVVDEHIAKPMARIRKSIEDIRDDAGLGDDRSSMDVDERIKDIEKAVEELAEEMSEKFESLVDTVEKTLDHLDEALGEELGAGADDGKGTDDGADDDDGDDDAVSKAGGTGGDDAADDDDDDKKKPSVVKTIEKAFSGLGDKLQSISDRLEKVEKVRGVKRGVESTSEDEGPDSVKKGEEDTWSNGSPFSVGSASRQ